MLITGVVDGPLTGGVPKAVEFYVLNDIADLSVYGFGSANNGGGTDGEEYTFPAISATAGTHIYIASESTGFTSFFGFAPDGTSGAANINGDDAIELFLNGSVIDVFGDINVDGTGQPWEHLDGWAYRVNNTGPDGSTFVLTNWTFSGPDALDGESTNASAATPFPIGTYVPPGGDAPPSVSSTTPSNGDFDVAVDANISVTFSENVTVASTWYEISCSLSGHHLALTSGGPQSFILNPDTDFLPNDLCSVTVLGAAVEDQDDNADNMVSDYVFSFEVPPAFGVCFDDTETQISEIQGSGLASPLDDAKVNIEGVVVAVFQDAGEMGGYFVQEEDADVDGNSLTSEGIYVFDNANSPSAGDSVRVQGEVDEFFELTELTNITNFAICNSNGTATPATVTLPVSDINDFEKYEGMAVIFPQSLTISEYFNFDRFNEIVLATDRLFQPTAVHEPGSPEAAALADLNSRSGITLDDGRTASNPDPALHPNGNIFDLTNLFRGGDLVTNATGVMHYAFDLYRIQPTQGADYTAVNVRPDMPEPVGGSLTVASFNVLNYFTTFDTNPGSGNGPNICGPDENLECRGANDANEFARQRDKIISAITEIDADIVGLIEIENNPTDAAVIDLVNGVNNAAGAGTYTYVATGPIGTDAIKVAFIYKPATVSPVGGYAILDSTVDPRFIDTKNRPVLAQTFEDITGDHQFTVAVNHLKSKGSGCGVGDDDPEQGSCNLTRTMAAEALVDWLATDPTNSGDPDYLIIGDLNSYDKEDPIDAVLAGEDDTLSTEDDYSDLVAQFGGEFAYSYLFSGQLGYLDYALANVHSDATGDRRHSLEY